MRVAEAVVRGAATRARVRRDDFGGDGGLRRIERHDGEALTAAQASVGDVQARAAAGVDVHDADTALEIERRRRRGRDEDQRDRRQQHAHAPSL